MNNAHKLKSGGEDMDENYTESGTDIDNVKKINKAFGLSYNDAIALLAQASQVQTTDEIALDNLYKKAKVESTRLRMNQLADENYMNRNKLT